jgi:SpoVK/Ycf46/Vps4 family AAA+-type ATPase
MTLWDGLTSANSSGMPAQIVVLGATNRINDIDEAILRRMPKKFPVPLPGLEQRRKILQLILQDTKTDTEHFDLLYVSKITAGMSGSDIKEACRDAAMAPVREYLKQHRGEGRRMASVDSSQFRGVRTDDFLGNSGGQIDKDRRISANNGVAAKRSSKSREPSDEYEDLDELVESQD